MTGSGWSDRAAEVIRTARSEGESLGLWGKALLEHIDARYPFGPRENHPYRQWLRVRRELCSDLPGVKPLERKPRSRRRRPDPNQGSLFDE